MSSAYLKLFDVHRLAQGGCDGLSEDKSVKYERGINAKWGAEHCRFQLITEEGEKSVRAAAHVHIEVGDFEHSSIRHLPLSEHNEEQFFLSLYLSQEWFDWLWNEIGSRPGDAVNARIRAMPWLAGIESHMWYEDRFRAIRLEPDSEIKVLDANLYVGGLSNVEPDEDDPPPLPEDDDSATAPVTALGKLERELETKAPDVWLKRIFSALVVIALILAFHRY